MRILESKWYWFISWSAMIGVLFALLLVGETYYGLIYLLHLPLVILAITVLRYALLRIISKYEFDECRLGNVWGAGMRRYERQVNSLLTEQGIMQAWEWANAMDNRTIRENRTRQVLYPIKLCEVKETIHVVFFNNSAIRLILGKSAKDYVTSITAPVVQTASIKVDTVYPEEDDIEDCEPGTMDWELDEYKGNCTSKQHDEAVKWINENNRVYDTSEKDAILVFQPEQLPADYVVWQEIKRIVTDNCPEISVIVSDASILFQY